MVVNRQRIDVLQNYLSRVRPHQRAALQSLYDVIVATAPDADVVVRRNVPAFRYCGRPLVSIGGAKRHVSLYVMHGHALDVHADELAGYDVSRTAVRFDPLSPIPTGLVSRLVRTRVREIEAVEGRPSRRATRPAVDV